MPIQIAPEILSSLETIDWLKACGRESSLSVEQGLRQVASWKEADSVYDERWELLVHNRKNEITSALCARYKDLYQQWNELIDSARQEVESRAKPVISRIIAELELKPFYTNIVCRDIQLYLMEMTYAQNRCKVPIFFRNLFQIYGVGHFPCGWGGGDFPVGFLYYY
jgi:hypothetical protein